MLRSRVMHALRRDTRIINVCLHRINVKCKFRNSIPTEDIRLMRPTGKARQGCIRFRTVEVHQFQVSHVQIAMRRQRLWDRCSLTAG